MKKLYCPYCGELLEDGCDCAREAAEAEAEFIEEHENRPETLAGWVFDDRMEMMRREQ